MADLLPGQIEVDGLLLGANTPYLISGFAPGGKPETLDNDRDRAYADGRVFGRDRLGGRTVAIEVTVDEDTIGDAIAAYSLLTRVWNSAIVRRTSSDVVAMRVRMFAETDTRVVWGRPRRFDPANDQLLDRGRIDVVADFACVDHLWYEDTPDPVLATTVQASTGAFTAPFVVPLASTTTASASGGFSIGGVEEAWLQVRINGPIVNPVVDILGEYRVELATSLLADQYVDIDARPWVRTAMRSDGANLAGTFSAATPPMSEMTLSPGNHTVVLRGQDVTGTATLTLWRQAAALHPYW